MTASLLLVHGAWHGPWAWRPLLDHLDGLDVHTVDLPSSGTDPAALGDLRADAEVVRAALAGIDGPAVVVGHSYGGVVVSEAATPDTGAAHLVYLCAFQLDVGESLLAAVGGQAPPWWEVHDGHVVATGPEEVFYNGCPPDLTSAAVGRLGLQSRAAFEQPLFAQEQMAARAGDVVRLPDGHSPFLSSPGEVARVLRDVAARAG